MSLRRSVPVLRSLANATSTPLPRSGRLLLAPASSRGAEGRCVGGVGQGGLRGGGLRDGRVLLPVGEAVQGVGVRGFGVIDSVQNKIISRNAAKQETQFREQMEELSLKESFDLDDFAKIIEEPLDKMSAKMPWNKNKQELKDMKMQREVLKALTKMQRKKPETIRAGHRQAIADKAKCSEEEVNKLLASFRELKAMHGWLSTRRKRKEKIPTSQEELRVMAGDPKGTMLMNFMRVKKNGSGRPSFGF